LDALNSTLILNRYSNEGTTYICTTYKLTQPGSGLIITMSVNPRSGH